MHRTVLGCFLFLFLVSGFGAYGQGKSKEPFCGKKWYCESIKDADGNVHVPEAGTENDYMLFLCDSNFILIENSTTLKGKWSFNDEMAMITLTQTENPNLPDKFSYHFMEYDEQHLVMIGGEGTHGAITAYLISK